MANIKSAPPWKIPATKRSPNIQRPGKANTVSPVSKSYGKTNRNPSGSHLQPDHVSGDRLPRAGTSIGLDKHVPRKIPASKNRSGSHLTNEIPKGKPGKSGTYRQK